MAYTELKDWGNTSEGIHVLFQYAAETVPAFIPLTLFALFTIITLGTYFSQKRLTGRGDFLSSFTVGGFVTAFVAIIMSLIEGLINTPTVVLCIIIAIVGVVLLFTTKRREL